MTSLPRIYVEVDEADVKRYIDNSGRALKRMAVVRDDGEVIFVDVGERLRIESKSKVYVQGIYDDAYAWLVDFETGIIRKNVIIVSPRGDIIRLNRGDKVYLIEATGRTVVPLVKLGEYVLEGRRLAAIFTGKREVRYLRSDVSGRIAYIAQVESKPHRYLIIMIPKERVSSDECVSP